MARSNTVYALALCSPTGLELERIAVREAAGEVNKVLEAEGLSVEVKGWDRDVRPSIGRDAQDVVNKQIIDEADIGVVIVGDRIGSATPRAPSGTVEEARSFIARKKNGDNVELMLFFKRTVVSYDSETISRISAVADFRAEMQASGVFWKEFQTDKELAELIRLHLPSTVRKFALPPSSETSAPSTPSEQSNARDTAETLVSIADEIEEGALDNEIAFADSFDAISGAAIALGSAAEEASGIMTPIVERLTDLGNAQVRDPRAMKSVIDELSAALDIYGERVSLEADIIEKNADIAIESTIRAIGFAGSEISGSPSDLNDLAAVIDETQASMWDMAASTENSAEAITALPRMTTKLNQAKKKVVRESNHLKGIVARFSERLSEASQAARERARQLGNEHSS